MSCMQRSEQHPCTLGSTGSCQHCLPLSLKINGGKDGADDLRGKSTWIGACHTTCVVGGGSGASALAWPQDTCSCTPHTWHAAV